MAPLLQNLISILNFQLSIRYVDTAPSPSTLPSITALWAPKQSPLATATLGMVPPTPPALRRPPTLLPTA